MWKASILSFHSIIRPLNLAWEDSKKLLSPFYFFLKYLPLTVYIYSLLSLRSSSSSFFIIVYFFSLIGLMVLGCRWCGGTIGQSVHALHEEVHGRCFSHAQNHRVTKEEECLKSQLQTLSLFMFKKYNGLMAQRSGDDEFYKLFIILIISSY